MTGGPYPYTPGQHLEPGHLLAMCEERMSRPRAAFSRIALAWLDYQAQEGRDGVAEIVAWVGEPGKRAVSWADGTASPSPAIRERVIGCIVQTCRKVAT